MNKEARELIGIAKSLLAVSNVLYHGVSKEAAGKSIVLDGVIKPGDLEKRSGYLKPVGGRVYLAQSLRY